MKDIPDKSVDMILCDLPYGTTECKWDSIISLDKLWKQYKRIINDNGIIEIKENETFDDDQYEGQPDTSDNFALTIKLRMQTI